MHIHEYQAKDLFKKNNINVPNFIVISNADDTAKACEKLGGSVWVVKAQVHAGGRGKGGGVIVCKDIQDALNASKKLLGSNLITPQTDSNGQPVNEVIIEAGQDIVKELYLGLLVDRGSERITVLASTEGGMDIEAVASETPEKIIKKKINPLGKITLEDCNEISNRLGLDNSLHEQFSQTLMGLYNIFTENDANLIEINPLIITAEKQIMALDGKIDFDDNALYRNESIIALRDISQEDEKERSASEYQLNYISLDGTVGCMVNGAGLAMGTMDLVKLHGGNPANFLDVGGGATKEAVSEAFKIILSDSAVKAVLINIFGGIVSCATIAEGIIGAVKEVGVEVPVVVRFEGNNSELGRQTLADSGLNIIPGESLVDAVEKAVAAAGGQS